MIRLLLLGCIILVVATIIGQIRADRFPEYVDLIIAAAIPLGLYLIVLVVALLMPVTIKSEGIKCYNTNSMYKEVLWWQIESVYFMSVYGLPYACVESAKLKYPLTIPLFLKDMDDFKINVVNYAGKENPLSEYLLNET